jgi:hypothetical protein
VSDFAASAYQIESTPPGLMRGGLAPGAVVGTSLVPDAYLVDTDGVSVDLTQSSGGGFAVVSIGDFGEGEFTVEVSLQQSSDNNTWGSIPNSAVLNVASSASTPITTIINFARQARYVRARIQFSGGGSGPANVCAIIGKQ